MTGGLTEEERLLQATAREFATREVAPSAIERDEAERYDRALFTRMGELGLTAAPLPEVVGGAGFSYLGWTTASSTDRIASERASAAVIAALVPYCIAKANQDVDPAKLAKFKAEKSSSTTARHPRLPHCPISRVTWWSPDLGKSSSVEGSFASRTRL